MSGSDASGLRRAQSSRAGLARAAVVLVVPCGLIWGLTGGLIGGLTGGCSGIKPGRRPEATFGSIRKAMLERKYEALWGLLSAKSRELKIAEVRQKQRDVEMKLNNMTAADKARYLRLNGVSPERFVNMSPAEVFARGMRKASRLMASLEEALAAAEVTGVRSEGDSATLEITLSDGEGKGKGHGDKEKVTLTLEREYGLYRVKSFYALLDAFRPAERARRPGATPKETFEAFRACVRDRAYRALWNLFSPFRRGKLAEDMEKLKQELREFSASERRSRERGLGVTVEEFLAMPPEEAFAVRFSIEVRKRLPPMLLGEFVSAEVAGEKATMLLRGRRGEYRIPMVLQDGVWLLEGF